MTDDRPNRRPGRWAVVIGAITTFGIEAVLVVTLGAFGFLVAVVMLALV